MSALGDRGFVRGDLAKEVRLSCAPGPPHECGSLMKSLSCVLVVLACGGPAFAAPDPIFLVQDRSTESLMPPGAADAVWRAQIQKSGANRLAKLYAPARWGFLSQVEGGFNEAKTCVVTARAALLPRSGKSLLFTPEKMATTFDAQPGATQEQCQALARAKLDEAVGAVMGSLVAPR